jgi:hypothetical protein
MITYNTDHPVRHRQGAILTISIVTMMETRLDERRKKKMDLAEERC